MSATSHNNNFNLIRLLAALQVVAEHALHHFDYDGPLVRALKVVPGVPMFFFLSGYLICTSYSRMRAQGKTDFFVNRFIRIYPALWACVAVSTIAVVLTGYLGNRDIAPARFILWLLGQTTFFQFYNPDFMRQFGTGVLNGALWTISVELQFYLLAPLLFHLFERRRVLAVIVFLLSLALHQYFRLHREWDLLYVKLAYVSFAPWLHMFMLGFAAAYFPRAVEYACRTPFWILIPAYVLSLNVLGPYTLNASNAINPVSFAILGALLLKFATTRVGAFPSIQRFIARSDFSYGMYLYHMPVINLLLFMGVATGSSSVVLTFVATAVAAALSWYVIERPALAHKR